MSFTQAELEKKLAELIDSHNVPGAQLAVLDGDTITEVAAGVLSLRTGSPVTTDALFLPGSIGKVYTATLVLMLADEGLIDLDEPVRTYLPDFEVRDEHARDTVTVRNLLTHTSGFDGDVFIDTGRGDDALERYITEIADLPQICEPGKIWSYSNSGFSVLGRLIEVVWDTVYETALRDRLLAPLGLEHSVVFPEDVIPHPNSVGHVPNPEDPESYVVSPIWGLYRSCGPMGASLVASAGDVLRFTLLHLDGGVAADGTRLLSAERVTAAQAASDPDGRRHRPRRGVGPRLDPGPLRRRRGHRPRRELARPERLHARRARAALRLLPADQRRERAVDVPRARRLAVRGAARRRAAAGPGAARLAGGRRPEPVRRHATSARA